MGVQDFIAPELGEIRGILTSMDKRLDAIEETNRAAAVLRSTSGTRGAAGVG